MPIAEIITIGTELLLGEIQDTNTRYLARALRESGINLFRTTMIGDNPERIAQVIRESMGRAQIVITTGGLGPTVDDPTRQAVALAMGVETEFRPELWEQIQARFVRYNRQATENNKRQAYIPVGATAIENPVGTAPAFMMERDGTVVISVPGVPREMEYLIENTIIPYLRDKFSLRGTIKASVLHASGIGESQVDEWIGDLETNLNPTVGLLAHPAQVDIRVTAKADSNEEAFRMISEMSAVIRERLGDNIFGIDAETLEGVVAADLARREWTLRLVECCTAGEIAARLQKVFPFTRAQVFDSPQNPQALNSLLTQNGFIPASECGLAVSLVRGPVVQELFLLVITPTGKFEAVRHYGGPPPMATAWAANTALDFLRRSIQ